MNSYNRINGVYASQNGWLQQQVARGEWGFQGLFVTDWGSSVDRIPGLENGTDLEMPSSGDLNTQRIIAAVKEGKLDENVLNERVDNVVNLILKAKKTLDEGKKTYDVDAHHDLACRWPRAPFAAEERRWPAAAEERAESGRHRRDGEGAPLPGCRLFRDQPHQDGKPVTIW